MSVEGRHKPNDKRHHAAKDEAPVEQEFAVSAGLGALYVQGLHVPDSGDGQR